MRAVRPDDPVTVTSPSMIIERPFLVPWRLFWVWTETDDRLPGSRDAEDVQPPHAHFYDPYPDTTRVRASPLCQQAPRHRRLAVQVARGISGTSAIQAERRISAKTNWG